MQDHQKEIQSYDHTRKDHGKIEPGQDKIIERIEEFYTKLYGSVQSILIHTNPKEIPEIAS